MRNEETWNKKIRPKMLPDFTPRLKRDMETLQPSEKLPALGSYFVYGDVYTGKTVWAAWMMLEALKSQYLNPGTLSGGILFFKTSEILNDLKACFDNPDRDEQVFLNQLSDADFLVLDDFGSERPTDWVLGILYLLVDRRYESMKHTIFTSNLSLDEIAEKFGDNRITSRIERMCKDYHKTKF
jgi:DNA replication protein DnaC